MSGNAYRPSIPLRREYEQVLDEKHVLEERLLSMRKKHGIALEALERQSALIVRLQEYIDGKDLVRTPEIRAILEEMLG